jgi:hypothetical protein
MGFRKAIETVFNGLTHLFPRPEVLAEANFSIVRIPGARDRTEAIACAVSTKQLTLDASKSLEDALSKGARRPWYR